SGGVAGVQGVTGQAPETAHFPERMTSGAIDRGEADRRALRKCYRSAIGIDGMHRTRASTRAGPARELSAGPVRGLLGGKDVTGRFVPSRRPQSATRGAASQVFLTYLLSAHATSRSRL